MSSTAIEEKKANDISQIKLFIGFIASVIVVIILHQLRGIFVPLCLALLLYFFFNGVYKLLLRKRIPKIIVLFFLLIFIFILLYFFGVLIYASISSFIDKFPNYGDKITEIIKEVFTQMKIPIARFHTYIEQLDITKGIDPTRVTEIISTAFGSFATFVGHMVLILIFLMFMLAGRGALSGRITKAFDPRRTNKIEYILNSIEDQVQQYLLIKTLINLANGIICGVILFAFGMDFYIFSALLIFVMHYIPNFGAVVATLFPISIAFLKFGFSLPALLIAILLTLVQVIIGNILEPKITGKSLNLSPILILISLIFWGYVWGVTGMILAVPVTSAIKIIFENLPGLRPIAEIISAE